MTRLPVFGLLASLFLAAPMVSLAAPLVADQDQDQDRDQDRLHEGDMEQLRTHLRKKLKLGQDDLDAIEPGLKRYFRLRGDQEHVRSMIQAGMDAGCTGVCLQEMVQSMNRAMVWGMQDKEAGAMVTDCLQDRIRDRDRTGANWTEEDLRERLHDRVQDRLRVWERDHDREMDREREREMDRERQREMDRGAERAREMGSAGVGGR